jgi:hypothetical protein
MVVTSDVTSLRLALEADDIIEACNILADFPNTIRYMPASLIARFAKVIQEDVGSEVSRIPSDVWDT